MDPAPLACLHTYDAPLCDHAILLQGQSSLSSTSTSLSSSSSLLSTLSSSSSIQTYTSVSSDNTSKHEDCTVVSAGLLSQSSNLASLPLLTISSPVYHEFTRYDHHCLLTQHPLDDAGHISCLTISTGGRYLYGASSSTSTIYIWLMEKLRMREESMQVNSTCMRVELGHNPRDGGVKSLVAIGEDKILSAHDSDNKIRVWRRSKSHNAAQIMHVADALYGPTLSNHSQVKLLSTMPTTKDYLRTFLFNQNYVRVRRHYKKLWIEHVDTISAMAVSSDARLLYSASWDRTIKVWKLPLYQCVESVRGAHEDAINCMVLSNDGRFLYTGSADTKIKVWGCQNMEGVQGSNGRLAQSLVSTLKGHRSAVNALALSSDGSVLYSGAGDKAIIVWERTIRPVDGAHMMVMAGTLRGHRQAILCLATVDASSRQDGSTECVEYPQQLHFSLCSGSADKSIRVWKRATSVRMSSDNETKKLPVCEYWCVAVLEGHTAPVKCLRISICHTSRPDVSLYVYSASLDKSFKVWRLSLHKAPPKILQGF